MKFIIWVILFSFILQVGRAQYRLYENGVHQYNSGLFQQAIENLSSYLGKNTRDKKLDVEVFYVRALAYYKSREFERAISDFQQTLLLRGKNTANLYWMMAKCYVHLQNISEAIKSYSLAQPLIRDSQKESQLRFERARLYMKAEENDLAEVDLKHALLLNPDHFLAQEALAELYSSSKQTLMKTPGSATASKRVALILGNGRYIPAIGELKNPVNDAVGIANELGKLGFETIVKVNQTAAETRKSIREFYTLLHASDPANTVALFYYAGHGLQFEGVNYIIPIDAIINSPKDLETLGISLDIVMDVMQYADVKMNIMILDACRSNPFPATVESLKRGLAPPNPTSGAFIGFATSPGGIASDGNAEHGLYTQELIKVLRIRGISIEQTFKKVRENVLLLSNGRQKTWDTSNIIADFYFNP